MANTTKTTKTATVAATPAKAEAAKAEVKTEVKAATTTAAKAEKTTEKKAAPKKTTETKATEKAAPKKAATKKATETAAAEKKTDAKKSELYVQFAGHQFSYDELVDKVKADYIAQTGKKTISSTKLYLKPEDMTVYYVINEKFMGHVYLG